MTPDKTTEHKRTLSYHTCVDVAGTTRPSKSEPRQKGGRGCGSQLSQLCRLVTLCMAPSRLGFANHHLFPPKPAYTLPDATERQSGHLFFAPPAIPLQYRKKRLPGVRRGVEASPYEPRTTPPSVHSDQTCRDSSMIHEATEEWHFGPATGDGSHPGSRYSVCRNKN